ncbi:MAG: rod shape-determining protein MreC [Thermoleophilia bacterium]
MNTELEQALTALMSQPGPSMDAARVAETRRVAVAQLARARARERHRRVGGLVGTGLLFAAAVTFLFVILPGGGRTQPENRGGTLGRHHLPKPTRAEAPNRPGHWWLYPDRSRVAQAAAAAVGAPVKWVQARRRRVDGLLIGTDEVSLRNNRKEGWELDWNSGFARWELGFPSTRTTGGEFWLGSQDGTMRSVYFVSGDGISVWVGHFAPSTGATVTTGEQLALARRFVAELRKRGDFRSTPMKVPAGTIAADLSAYAMVRSKVIKVSADPRMAQVTINRGYRDGVQLGFPVMEGTPPTTMVGLVTSMTASSSEVTLLRSGRTGLMVEVAGSGGLQRSLTVTATGEFRISGIPAGQAVQPNQTVVTAGITVNGGASRIPRGLNVGSITRVVPDAKGQEAAVITPSSNPTGNFTLTVLRHR